MIDDLAAFGCPVLLFSGGEPCLRPDFVELMGYAKSRGLRVVLSTNGTLITPALAQAFAQVGLSYVGVSLDGLKAYVISKAGARLHSPSSFIRNSTFLVWSS